MALRWICLGASLLWALSVRAQDCKAGTTQSVSVNMTHKAGYCAWYGQCATNAANKYYPHTAMTNCYYNGPAHNGFQDETFYSLLLDVCPWYAHGKNTTVCCDIAQLKALQNQTGVAQQLFSRCPACYKNFMHHFCATTCSPDQSLFFQADKPDYVKSCTIEKNGTEENVTFFEAVDVVVQPEYANKLYNSCVNVQYSQTNQKVISALMCGTHQDDCNPQLWLEFLGNPDLDYGKAPFLMNYILSSHPYDSTMVPLNFTLSACDNTSSPDTCNCADCPSPKLCPPPPEPATSFPYWIVSVSIAAFGFVFSLCVCCLLYTHISFVIFWSQRHRSHLHSKSEEKCSEDENMDFTESITSSINGEFSSSRRQEKVESCGPCCVMAQIGAWIEYIIQSIFYKWGLIASQFWYVVIPAVLLVSGFFVAGVYFFEVTTDPVELWSAPNSQARVEKNYFDDNFGPFYRTEQVVIKASPNFTNYTIYTDLEYWTDGPVFFPEVLMEAFYLQNNLTNLSAPRYDKNGTFIENVTIEDICFKPLYPDNKNCTIESVFGYFQNSFERLNYTEYDDFGLVKYNASYHIHYCLMNPTAMVGQYVDYPCLGAYGGPIDPNTILGGFEGNEYEMSTTMLITFIVNNHVDEEQNARAEAWESAFIKYLKNYTSKNFNFSFSSERSITDEINRESKADVVTIAVSYLIMFLYITLFLGHVRSLSTLLVDLKILLGLCGVSIVLLAVGCSLGFLSYMHVTASLIILEVVPFLVLAVGVDNLFILVHAYEREVKKVPHKTTAELVAQSLARVAPSLCLTASSEAAAFLLGAISSMPAVRAFSLYAGVAVLFNFMLQVSVFVSVMYLDALRQRHNRMDVICIPVIKTEVAETCGGDGLLLMFMKKIWTQVVLNKLARPLWVLLFGWTFFGSLALSFRVQTGLDQRLALPKDSYLQDWFNDLNEYLHIGPPVYFVIEKGYNYTPTANQNLVCSGGSCNAYSFGTQLAVASRNPGITTIAEPASLWLDSYYQWLQPSGQCCGYLESNSSQECYDPAIVNGSACTSCLPYTSGTVRPSEEQFLYYLPWFLSANPTVTCATAGHAAYASAVVLNKTDNSVITSYAMTYHTILRNSSDYIDALKQARIIGANLTKTLNVSVFPYSVFYVYYEQYLFIVHDMFLNVGVSLIAVFLVTFALLGLNLWGAAIVIGVVAMILVHMLGVMALLGINANAVSLVNLVMTVGIAVEFCSHIVRWFIVCDRRTRLDRARSALAHMGSSVVSGITITKFLGVFVLYFAKSQLFQVYYFRMYISMVIIGAAHGLIFLPILLSYVGPAYYCVKRPNPFPEHHASGFPSAPPEPVYSGTKSGPSTETPPHKYPPATHSSQPSSIYPNLPSDINATSDVPYSQQHPYPPATWSKQNGVPVGETTPLLQ